MGVSRWRSVPILPVECVSYRYKSYSNKCKLAQIYFPPFFAFILAERYANNIDDVSLLKGIFVRAYADAILYDKTQNREHKQIGIQKEEVNDNFFDGYNTRPIDYDFMILNPNARKNPVYNYIIKMYFMTYELYKSCKNDTTKIYDRFAQITTTTPQNYLYTETESHLLLQTGGNGNNPEFDNFFLHFENIKNNDKLSYK